MFDWDDEELASIIWGEDWEGNICNDPFSGQIQDLYKKGTNEQTSCTVRAGVKKPNSKSEHGVKLGRVSVYDVGASAFGPDSWLSSADPSPPNAAKVDQNSLCIDEFDYLRQDDGFDKNSEIFEKPDEEEGDTVLCGWENIGSFEDLDRMFSDSDTMFGDMADSNAGAIWPSSKDLTDAPLKSTSLAGDSYEQSDITDHNVPYPRHSSSGYYEINDAKYEAPDNVQTFVTEGSIQGSHKLLNQGAAANHNGTQDKGNRQRRFKNHFVPSMLNPSLELDQQIPSLHNSQDFLLKQPSSVHLSPPCDGSIMNYYAGPADLLSSGYEAPPINATSSRISEDAPAKPPSMTPREKIEKLRRRQKMRAILAIQKQQMHSNSQGSVSENFSTEGGKVAAVRSVSNFPIHDTSSLTEKNDPGAVGMAMGNCSVEESILYRLQETVAKLDMRLRLSIRDSLFRLANSARQRQYPNDTNSTCANSRNETCSNKDMIRNQRLTKVTAKETETNPIDRTVARMLFHVDLSGKLAETSESPSSKSIANARFIPDVSESSQLTFSNGMKTSSIFSCENQSGSTTIYQGGVEMESKTFKKEGLVFTTTMGSA